MHGPRKGDHGGWQQLSFGRVLHVSSQAVRSAWNVHLPSVWRSCSRRLWSLRWCFLIGTSVVQTSTTTSTRWSLTPLRLEASAVVVRARSACHRSSLVMEFCCGLASTWTWTPIFDGKCAVDSCSSSIIVFKLLVYFCLCSVLFRLTGGCQCCFNLVVPVHYLWPWKCHVLCLWTK